MREFFMKIPEFFDALGIDLGAKKEEIVDALSNLPDEKKAEVSEKFGL